MFDILSQSIKNTKKEVVLPALQKLRKLTNNSNLKSSKVGKAYFYNCWGFTAYSYQWIDELKWFEFEEMEYCLAKFTKRVSKPENGDIVVFRDNLGEVIHTGIVIDAKKTKIIHKPGSLKLEVNTLGAAIDRYSDDVQELTYRRPLKNKKFNFKTFCKSPYNE